MGGQLATPFRIFPSFAKTKPEANPLDWILPVYYTKDPLTDRELQAALKAWSSISSNRASNYIQQKRHNPDFPYSTCSEYFYDLFYERLFEVHPNARPLFKKSKKRMRQYFIGSFTMLLDSVTDSEKFTRSLISLAHVHNNIGVKAIEYGIVGEVIFTCLGKVCGDEFQQDGRTGWIKIISRILDVVLPIVINFELKNGELMKKLTDPRGGPPTTNSANSANSAYSESAESSENFRTNGSIGGNSQISKSNNDLQEMGVEHCAFNTSSNNTCPVPHDINIHENQEASDESNVKQPSSPSSSQQTSQLSGVQSKYAA